MGTPIRLLTFCLIAANLAALTPTIMAKPETRNRAEIPDAYKWDVSKIYPSWEAWEADLKRIDGYIKEYVAFKGTLKDGPENLAKVYALDDEIGQLAYKLYRYPALQRDVDLRNTDASGKLQRVSALFAKLNTATSWFTPELLSVPEATTME